MRHLAFALAATLLPGSPLRAQDDATATPGNAFQPEHTMAPQWRNLGPANMGGRVTDFEAVRGKPWVWYVATAGGGLWRSPNAGTTFEPLFEHQPTASIGDVAVAPSDDQVIWVGTGEENARNSVQWGDGVYKSTDGGKTFQHMGLAATFQIGHIAIHPTQPDTVYVAALGRLWGENPERGVFRTRDGGATWQHVLQIDARTGCVDVRLDPQQPDRVYAVAYERQRDGFDSNDPAKRFGPGSGLYKSEDGGDTWRQLEQGLPTCLWGRAGLSVWEKEPKTVFAIIETERSGWATGDQRDADPDGPPPDKGYVGVLGDDAGEGRGARIDAVTEDGPAEKAGLQTGDVLVQIGDTNITSWSDLAKVLAEAKVDDETKLTVRRDGVEQELELIYGPRPGARDAGGPGARSGSANGPFGGRLGGQNANIHEEQGDNGFETGGVFRSDDHGETWRRVNSLTERPFYYSVIAVDPRDDQRIYTVGVQLYGTEDGGAEFNTINRGIHVDFHAIWVDPEDSLHLVAGCDGGLNETHDGGRTWEVLDNLPVAQFYHVDCDSSVPYRVFGGLQDNGTWIGPSRTAFREGITRHDWFKFFEGDGFRAIDDPTDADTIYATSQNGNLGRVDLRTGAQARVAKPRGAGSFNWDTPFFLSPHNPRMLYFAGEHAFRSLDRGGQSVRISKEPLGLTDRGTATAMAESPRRPGLLYVGTDDGALWRSFDEGFTWEELHENVPGLEGPRYVSSIEPSTHEEERVYVTLDGHRSDDFATHVYVSEDAGDTWTWLGADLPDAPCHIVREDPGREDLLFLGTEFSCWVSLDRGGHWLPLGHDLPTVAVRDLAIQDRDQDLVAATHGRGLWVVDIAPLRQLSDEVARAEAHLFAPEPLTLWTSRSRGLTGDRTWRAQNPPSGAVLYASFAAPPPAGTELTVHDVTGKQIGSVELDEVAGVQRVVWSPNSRRGRRGGGGRGGGGGSRLEPGNYSVRLTLGDETQRVPLRVLPDPTLVDLLRDGTQPAADNTTETAR